MSGGRAVPQSLKMLIQDLDVQRREIHKNIKKIKTLHSHLGKSAAKEEPNAKREVYWSRLRSLYFDTIELSEKEESLASDCATEIGRVLEDQHVSQAKKRKRESSGSGAVLGPGSDVVFWSSTDWVLGRVDKYHPKAKQYRVIDADESEGRKVVPAVPAKDVYPLDSPEMSKGDRVLAVWPVQGATCLYPAEVHSFRKKAGKFIVQFDDDFDNGRPLKKHVDQRHVIRLLPEHNRSA